MKKPPLRKGRESFFVPLLTACIAFAVMAGVCFWGISQARQENERALSGGRASAAGESFRALPRIGAFSGEEDKASGVFSFPFFSTNDNENRSVASALSELQGLPQRLPYEESLHPSLEERIRQVDYAIMQALWMRSLPASNIRLAGVKQLRQGDEPYYTQSLDILPGDLTQEFMLSLRDSLGVWADTAVLRHEGDSLWSIRLDDLETHRLRIFAGRDAFPAGGDDAPKGGFLPDSFPAFAYLPSRPHESEPKLVIVIDDLGESLSAVNRLLALEYSVTFAFWPHASHTAKGARAAHRRGREILVHQPMEPEGYPAVKPGPGVLLTDMTAEDIRRRVSEGITKVPYAVGLNNHMGSRFTCDRAGVDAVVKTLRERNLFMLDSLTHNGSLFAGEGRRLGLQTYRRSLFLDVAHTKRNVLDQLKRAERIALLTGQSIAIGHPLPETLAALEEWQLLRNRSVRIVRLQDL